MSEQDKKKVTDDFERITTHLCRVHNLKHDKMLQLLGSWLETKTTIEDGSIK